MHRPWNRRTVLRTYLAARPTVYLPTHDPLSPARLTAGRVTMIPL